MKTKFLAGPYPERTTPLIRRLHALAKRHRLTIALGRALYATSRHYNEGRAHHPSGRSLSWREDLALMKRCRPLTAATWLSHWCAGGSLKALGRSHAAEARRRARYRAEHLERTRTTLIAAARERFVDWDEDTVKVVH